MTDHTESQVIDSPVDEDEEDTGEHTEGDGCAIYDTGYTVLVPDDPDPRTDVEDLEVGDFYNDPAHDPVGSWMVVDDIAVIDDEVHIDGHWADSGEMPGAA